jgi:hypothetical protein
MKKIDKMSVDISRIDATIQNIRHALVHADTMAVLAEDDIKTLTARVAELEARLSQLESRQVYPVMPWYPVSPLVPPYTPTWTSETTAAPEVEPPVNIT